MRNLLLPLCAFAAALAGCSSGSSTCTEVDRKADTLAIARDYYL
jgi:hypothetical protein